MKDWLWIIGSLALGCFILSSAVLFIVYQVSKIDWHDVARETGSVVGAFKEGMEE